jgi:DNA polymerase I-like protein with 3'-5' exonuclease and polymerase domains
MNLTAHHTLPNIRKFFVPDPGFTIADSDLDRADLQVVVWEADDQMFKHALKSGIDVHLMNGIDLENLPMPPLDELVETHANYPEHKARYKKQRQLAKSWVHGTNYGGSAATMARAAKISTAQSELLQRRWFAAHPGIKDWHERTEASLLATRSVTNRFGFRKVYFDRIDQLLPQALAWVPQSTVAIYINKVWDIIEDRVPEAQVLLQVHDSLVWQAPTHTFNRTARTIQELASQIIVPYDDPLVIPLGVKSSVKSWGDVD